MESVLFISRFFRRLITRIRGCLLHTAPAVCRHCSTSSGVNATLAEAARRGHVECVKACLTAGADVNTEGSAPGELMFKSFPWGVFMFKYFPWCVLTFEYFPWAWDLRSNISHGVYSCTSTSPGVYFCTNTSKKCMWCIHVQTLPWTWGLFIPMVCIYVQILPMGSTSVEILPMGTGIILVQ